MTPVEVHLADEGRAISTILSALDDLPNEFSVRRVLAAVNNLASPPQPVICFENGGHPLETDAAIRANLEALRDLQGDGEEEDGEGAP